MWFLLLNILHCSSAFPIFAFDGSSTLSLSFTTLVKDVRLPDVYILCLSVKQARFDFLSVWERFSRMDENEASDFLKCYKADDCLG